MPKKGYKWPKEQRLRRGILSKDAWINPEYRIKQSKSWQNLDRRLEARRRMIEEWAKNPDRHIKHSQRMTEVMIELWRNPDNRAKIVQALNTPEVKRLQSLKSSDNPNWRGGIACLPYDSNFDENLRKYTRAKYGYTCQLCGIPQSQLYRKLSCHHIDYNKKFSTEDNLIPLCHICNVRVNFNREFWKEYFNWKKIFQLPSGENNGYY